MAGAEERRARPGTTPSCSTAASPRSAATGHPEARRIELREAFIFVSSPGAVTPFHIDPEWNFLLQVRGRKIIHVFPADDRSLVSEEELERFYSGGHRNLAFRE